LGLLDGEIFSDPPRDGLSDLPRRQFDARKRGFRSAQVVPLQIDPEFLGEPFHRQLIFLGPRAFKHAFILELKTCTGRKNHAPSISDLAEIHY
jgi:hypothetical protein